MTYACVVCCADSGGSERHLLERAARERADIVSKYDKVRDVVVTTMLQHIVVMKVFWLAARSFFLVLYQLHEAVRSRSSFLGRDFWMRLSVFALGFSRQSISYSQVFSSPRGT